MRTIVLGFPRSGTKTLSKVYNLGHEEFNKNGISDWHLLPTYKIDNNDDLIHVVRNPVDCISSNFYTALFDSIQFLKQSSGIEKSTRVLDILIRSWIYWNKKIRELAPDLTIKIEEIATFKENVRKHPNLDFNELDINPKLLEELRTEAKIYGYEI